MATENEDMSSDRPNTGVDASTEKEPDGLTCDICGKGGFSGFRALAGHKAVHSRKDSKSETSSGVQASKRDSSVEDLHCIVCGKEFQKKSRLEEHQNHHWKYPYYLDEETPACKLCGEQLSKYGFHRHKCFLGIGDGIDGRITTTNNSKPERLYECDICKKTYALYKPFKMHMKSHNVDEPPPQKVRYKCEECDKEFDKKSNYEYHMLKHTGKRPYLCDICGKGFRSKSDLIRHKSFHSGDRQHKCDICDRAFFCKWDAVEHRNTHTGALPFQCELCGKVFNRRRSLRSHHEVHIKRGEMIDSKSGKETSSALGSASIKTEPEETDTANRTCPQDGGIKLKLILNEENGQEWQCMPSRIASEEQQVRDVPVSQPISNNRMGLFDSITRSFLPVKTEPGSKRSDNSYQDAQLLLGISKPFTNSNPHTDDTDNVVGIVKIKTEPQFSGNIFSNIANDYPTFNVTFKTEDKGSLEKDESCKDDRDSLRSLVKKYSQDTSKTSYPGYDFNTAKCLYCEATFTSYNKVYSHVQREHLEEKNADLGKWRKFLANASLLGKPSSHTCDICGLHVHSRASLRRHKKTHLKYSSDGTKRCEYCHKKISKFLVARHYCEAMKSQDAPRPKMAHKCEECGNEYVKKSSLTSHVAMMHSADPIERFTCKLCDKSYRRRTGYEKHMMQHTGERPFLCSHCGKGFLTKGDLNRHYQFHVGDRPHQCDKCERAFTCKWDLEEHHFVHTGERKHACDVCGKCFGRKRSLRCHKKTHTVDKE